MNEQEQACFDVAYLQHRTALKIIEAYAFAVRRAAQYFDRFPDDLTTDELKRYFSDLIDSHSWSAVKIDRNGLRFFYQHVLGQAFPWVDMVKPPRVQSLPDLLSRDEIARIIRRNASHRYQTFWIFTYSMGRRLGETLRLTVADIDAARMRVHVRHSKGNNDRFVILPDLCLTSPLPCCAASGPGTCVTTTSSHADLSRSPRSRHQRVCHTSLVRLWLPQAVFRQGAAGARAQVPRLARVAGAVVAAFVTFVLATPVNAAKLADESTLTSQQRLGKRLFFDAGLSHPGGQSCGTCHAPNVAFTDPEQQSPTSNGVNTELFGQRNAPSAMYMAYSPAFHFDVDAATYVGCQFYDGRAATLEDLLTPK